MVSMLENERNFEDHLNSFEERLRLVTNFFKILYCFFIDIVIQQQFLSIISW